MKTNILISIDNVLAEKIKEHAKSVHTNRKNLIEKVVSDYFDLLIRTNE